MGAFISIVGNQIMAVLNPVIALLNTQKDISDVYLLHSASMPNKKQFSEVNAEKIHTWLSKSGFKGKIHLIPVSTTLLEDAEGRKPVQEALQTINDSQLHIHFNLAGGMNFQIAACMNLLSPEKTVYIYPESSGIHEISVTEGGVIDKRIMPYRAETVQTVLTLQGVHFKILNKSILPYTITLMDGLFKKCFSEGGKKDLGWYEKNVQIGNVVFERIYNNGNELVFLKVPERGSDIDDMRDLINLATNRRDFGELLHHSIVVITDVPEYIERLHAESMGKIVVVNPRESPCDSLKKSFALFQRLAMSSCVEETTKTGNSVTSNTTLYLALGRDVLPSLIALWSHRPKKACFLYTADNSIVCSYKDAFIRNVALLPCEEVSFVPVSIHGTEILAHRPITNEDIELNITPGTKGQGAFLSLFARMHGGSIWSLTDQLKQIPTGDMRDIIAPPINTLLKLSGIKEMKIFDYSSKYDRHYQGINEFIGFLIACKRLGEFPGQELELGKDKYYKISEKDRKGKPRKGTITIGKEKFIVMLSKDAWFETLIAWAMRRANADDVKLNLQLPWTEETRKVLQGRLAKRGLEQRVPYHRTEIDVVARCKNKYYVISCKSGKTASKKKAIAELKGAAPIFGRFAIPLLAFLRHGEKPEKIDGVYVFGYETFSNPEAMRDLLVCAEKECRTTL